VTNVPSVDSRPATTTMIFESLVNGLPELMMRHSGDPVTRPVQRSTG
jgi:hypothetical protein